MINGKKHIDSVEITLHWNCRDGAQDFYRRVKVRRSWLMRGDIRRHTWWREYYNVTPASFARLQRVLAKMEMTK